jgi:hypothetical protein
MLSNLLKKAKYLLGVAILLTSLSCLGTTVLRVPFTFFNSSASEWDAIIQQLNYGLDTNYVLLWSGQGGSVDMALGIIDKIKHAKKKVRVRITGPSVSAHALIMCYAPELVDFHVGVLILHNAFDGRDDEGHKIFNDSTTRDLLEQCTVAGVITRHEADLIVQNKLRMTIYPNGSHETTNDWS